jgi:NAD(P)-dependent dehydrogenase (short-subunit alcohol dehydrogenase family)
MDLGISQRTAAVAAASAGLGFASAQALANEGYASLFAVAMQTALPMQRKRLVMDVWELLVMFPQQMVRLYLFAKRE